MKLIKFLTISFFILLASNNSQAKVVTLTDCFFLEKDTSRFSGIFKDIWSPSNRFKNHMFSRPDANILQFLPGNRLPQVKLDIWTAGNAWKVQSD